MEIILLVILVVGVLAVAGILSSAQRDKAEKAAQLSSQKELAEAVRHSPLIECSPPFNLHKGETCHYVGPANLVRMKVTRARGAYHGPTMRVRLAKGVYYRAGAFSGGVTTQESWTTVDTGFVTITSKRVLFKGEKQTDSVYLDKALSIQCFEDGSIRIDKEKGKPFVMNGCQAVVMEAILERIIGRPIESSYSTAVQETT